MVDDISTGQVAYVDLGLKPTSMKFLNSYFHDGLAGAVPWCSCLHAALLPAPMGQPADSGRLQQQQTSRCPASSQTGS